jgi:predicted N-acyltransferase
VPAQEDLSSFHLLFGSDEDVAACAEGLMLRHTVQFHWTKIRRLPRLRRLPEPGAGKAQEDPAGAPQGGRKPASPFRCRRAKTSAQADWDFFYRCYERTYLEHGNAPYLTRDFFRRMASTMPENWLLFIAER